MSIYSNTPRSFTCLTRRHKLLVHIKRYHKLNGSMYLRPQKQNWMRICFMLLWTEGQYQRNNWNPTIVFHDNDALKLDFLYNFCMLSLSFVFRFCRCMTMGEALFYMNTRESLPTEIRALSHYCDMTLSQEFYPMGAQLSLKAALPLAERIATASDHCSKTGPRIVSEPRVALMI